jgi:hypothetical protein
MPPEAAARVYADPRHWLACGFGIGLAPVAPGTFGSLPGLLLAWVLVRVGGQAALAVGIVLVTIAAPGRPTRSPRASVSRTRRDRGGRDRGTDADAARDRHDGARCWPRHSCSSAPSTCLKPPPARQLEGLPGATASWPTTGRRRLRHIALRVAAVLAPPRGERRVIVWQGLSAARRAPRPRWPSATSTACTSEPGGPAARPGLGAGPGGTGRPRHLRAPSRRGPAPRRAAPGSSRPSGRSSPPWRRRAWTRCWCSPSTSPWPPSPRKRS